MTKWRTVYRTGETPATATVAGFEDVPLPAWLLLRVEEPDLRDEPMPWASTSIEADPPMARELYVALTDVPRAMFDPYTPLSAPLPRLPVTVRETADAGTGLVVRGVLRFVDPSPVEPPIRRHPALGIWARPTSLGFRVEDLHVTYTTNGEAVFSETYE